MKKSRFISAALVLPTAFLLNVPLALASTVAVTGNGADSSNIANVSVSRVTNVFQSNKASVGNSVNATSTTGSNSANENTGADTSIKTGDATTNLVVNNLANKSAANLACCDSSGIEVKIAGNGANSDNKVNLNLNNRTDVVDTKALTIHNNFNLDAKTGNNKANENTGGNASITTGDALISLVLNNSGNFNQVSIGNITNPGVTVNPPAPLPGVSPVVVAAAAAIPGRVLGATLPNTGFDYPYKLIGFVTAGLILSGLALRNQSAEVELLVTKLVTR